MAQDLRSRLSPWLLSVALGCGAGEPAPRAVATGGMTADQLLAAVLDECHGPLRGRMNDVDATVTLPDGMQWRLYAALPVTVRLQSTAGQFLLRDGALFRLPHDAPPTTAAELELALQLRDLVDAGALGPLHRGRAAARTGPTTLVVTDADGVPCEVTLPADTLLPRALRTATRPPVQVLDWTRTPTTWLPTTLHCEALGACRVEFNLSGLNWAADFFARPGTAAKPVALRMAAPGSVTEVQSPVPIVVETKALTWASVADPGDWPARAAAYLPLHKELLAQQQWIAGFPVFWQEHGERWLAAPFRGRAGGAAFAPPAGWRLRQIAAGRWLVVFPPTGDLAARLAEGERLLREALQQYDLVARSPITAQPYFHLEDGAPPATALAAPVVRMAVAID
ncbi:MAG: hypothetical protein MUC36_12405 [Planctomycetes bacterium]|nr:hypothetical protein [Planctomycetota bacterium]